MKNELKKIRKFSFKPLGYDERFYYWKASPRLGGNTVRTGKSVTSIRASLHLLWSESERISNGWKQPLVDAKGRMVPGRYRENLSNELSCMIRMIEEIGANYS